MLKYLNRKRMTAAFAATDNGTKVAMVCLHSNKCLIYLKIFEVKRTVWIGPVFEQKLGDVGQTQSAGGVEDSSSVLLAFSVLEHGFVDKLEYLPLAQ